MMPPEGWQCVEGGPRGSERALVFPKTMGHTRRAPAIEFASLLSPGVSPCPRERAGPWPRAPLALANLVRPGGA